MVPQKTEGYSMASTELAVIDSPDEAIEALRGNLVVTVENPEVVAAQIMERILTAENVDDILGGKGTISGQDVVDRPFTLNNVKYMRSAFAEGMPVFAVLDVSFLDDGENAAVTSSARNVMAQAAALWKLDALPVDVVIRKTEKDTANGYRVYYLEKA